MRGGGREFCGFGALLTLGLFTWGMLALIRQVSVWGFCASSLSFDAATFDALHRFWTLLWTCFFVSFPVLLWTFGVMPFVRPRPVLFRGVSMHRLWLVILLLCRVGEASVPGPGSLPDPASVRGGASVWQLAVCNPSGLGGKAFTCLDSPHDVVLLSETHLTAPGKRAFFGALRSSGSTFRNMITSHPVPPRHSSSQVGQWSGTVMLSRWPLRALPHGFDSLTYESGRLCVGSFCVRGLWVHGCVVYGPPTGPTHPQAKAITNHLLELAFQRISSLPGLRFVAGDWNHDLARLEAIGVMRTLGFEDVQTLHKSRTGQAPRATCKFENRHDYLFLSPELAGLFSHCSILEHDWTDHAEVVGHFTGGQQSLEHFPWPIPDSMDWSNSVARRCNPSVDFLDPTLVDDQYESFWTQVERTQRHALRQVGIQCPNACLGRGKFRGPQRRVSNFVPPKASRCGEKQPAFLGSCLQHIRWSKQARRLRSYCRLARVETPGQAHRKHACSLWHSIVHACGFPGGFLQWWNQRFHALGEPLTLPVAPPSSAFAILILMGFEAELDSLEFALRRSKDFAAWLKRASDPYQMFAAVRRESPAQVSTLIRCVSAIVVDDPSDASLSLDSEHVWLPDASFVHSSGVVAPLVVTPDRLWLDDVSSYAVGNKITQSRHDADLATLFAAFEEQWTTL